MRITKYFQMLQGMFSHSQGHALYYGQHFIFLLSISTYFTFTVVDSLWCVALLLREQFASSLGVHLK